MVFGHNMAIYYIVLGVEKKHDIDLFGYHLPIDLTWSDGMVGVIPIFKTEEDAKRYAGKNLQIQQIETMDKSNEQNND